MKHSISNHTRRICLSFMLEPSDFQIVVLRLDIRGVNVYRREINVVNFIEGQSERTFFLLGYDSRVFRVKIGVFDTIPLQDEYYE